MSPYFMVSVLGIVDLSILTAIDCAHFGGKYKSGSKQIQYRDKRSIRLDLKNNATIYYDIDQFFKPEQKDFILKQIKKINHVSCVQWLPKGNRTKATVYFMPSNTLCYTQMNGRRDTSFISLNQHCFDDGWVLHEMFHALGFRHEHTRRDRDCYLVVAPHLRNSTDYKIDPQVEITYPYDFGSVMHYRHRSELDYRPEVFSQLQDIDMGSFEEMTVTDIQKLHYYFCGAPHYCTFSTFKEMCEKHKQYINSFTPSCVK